MASSDPEQRLRCVSCDKRRPADGKLLHCMHVMCATCLIDSQTLDGAVDCVLCPHMPTVVALRGVALLSQLADSQPILYDSKPTAGDDSVDGAHCEAAATASLGGETSVGGVGAVYECQLCIEGNKLVATFRCVDCDGAKMCTEHAEGHLKLGPTFAKHCTEPLSPAVSEMMEDGTRGRVSVTRTKCLLHRDRDVTDFCWDCQQVACITCLARGHEKHDIVSITEAAYHSRCELHKTMGTVAETACESWDSDDDFTSQDDQDEEVPGPVDAKDSSDQPVHSQEVPELIDALSAKVLADVTAVDSETEAASRTIVAVIDRMKEQLDAKKQQLLDYADKLRWAKQQPLQSRQQRLRILKQRHDNLAAATRHISSTATRDAEVVGLAADLQSNWTDMTDQLDSEEQPFQPIRIAVDCDDASLQKFAEALEGVLKFCKSPTDLQRSKVVFPRLGRAGNLATVEVELCDSLGDPIGKDHPLPDIKAICSLQESESPAEGTVSIDQSNPDKITATAHMALGPVGIYTLSVSCANQTVSSQLTAAPQKIRFDRKRCSSSISLAGDNRSAFYLGSGGGEKQQHFVFAEPSLKQPLDSCTVIVHGGRPLATYDVILGVATLPVSTNYNTVKFGDLHRFLWYRDGGGRKNGATAEGATTSAMQSGDRLTFMLNRPKKLLMMHNLRTGRNTYITGVDAGEKSLHFFACFSTPGWQVEIY